MKLKWIIVVVLTIVALFEGPWTAIGVFVLGAIIVSFIGKDLSR